MDMAPQKSFGPQAFLPTTREEMRALGIEQLDVIIVTGDAYVDHPAFGAAMVGRYVQSLGCTVGIIAMPDVKRPESFAALGAPRYFFGVTAGNVDSMLSLFTAQKKPRGDDPYVPGGRAGARPQRATIAYCNAIRQALSGASIVIGGVEASLRRIVHYDFWSDSLRQPILLDAKADLLVYGMAEHPLRAIVSRFKRGESPSSMLDIPGTGVRLGAGAREAVAADAKNKFVRLPSFEEIRGSRQAFSRMTKLFYENPGAAFLQDCGTLAVLINKPAEPLTQGEIDRLYELPFTYHPHPSYRQAVPAFEQIKDSVTVVRGCFGGCNFCGLGAHQGKTIQSRSKESVAREIRRRSQLPGWKGVVSDLGGPTANMYGLSCGRPRDGKPCTRRSCLSPSACAYLHTSQSAFADLIRTVCGLDMVKHVAINSGIRMDLALLWPEIIDVVAKRATGGQLSVAPEHLSRSVLSEMGKPEETGWQRFEELFASASVRAGKQQYLVPYFIAGHPGSTLRDAAELGDFLRRKGIKPRNVQEYIPIPMTVSCSVYATGEDPFTGRKVPVTYKLSEVRRQKELIMWWQAAAPHPRRDCGSGRR
jgi:uncharacterized radical SAM protein YgiQ